MATPEEERLTRWLAQEIPETVLEPELAIIDTHHHLWKNPSRRCTYVLEDLWADTDSGHNIEMTVFIDSRSCFREDGPEHLKPIGETEFVATVAEQSAKISGKATIGAIVSHADMNLGAAVEAVLSDHVKAGKGLFSGIRSAFPPDLEPEFLQSFAMLGKYDLTFDNYSPDYERLPALAKLADLHPEVPIIVNHLGGKINPEADADEFANWLRCINAVARCPNVHMKVGGAQQRVGSWEPPFHMNRRERPIGSEELCELLYPYYICAIEAFGPDRCMFESNFPVDKECVSYRTLWNTFKRIASRAGLSESEKTSIFSDTAARVYRSRVNGRAT